MTRDDGHEGDAMDARLIELARGYNEPPAVPREDMWAAIQAGLASAPVVQGGADAADVPGVIPMHRRRRVAPWMSMAAAAVLLVAVGVGIGRMSVTGGAGAGDSAPVVATIDSGLGTGDSALVAPGSQSPVPSSDSPVIEPSSATQRSLADRGSTREVPEAQRERVERSPDLRSGDLPSGGALENRAYAVAAVKHLTDVEALLTAFRAEPSREVDAQIAGWARRLLSDTRLLMDSPAARDPLRRRLLEDLELVLVQIVQLSPEAAQQDRALIEGSMNRDQVLTRLRSAIPAGPPIGI